MYARPTYRPHLTNLDAIIWHGRDIRSNENRIYLQIALIFSVRSLAFGTSKFRQKLVTAGPDFNKSRATEIRSIMWLCNIFRFLVRNFTRVTALVKHKLRWSQLQTFDRLTDGEVTALETLMPILVEPQLLARSH